MCICFPFLCPLSLESPAGTLVSHVSQFRQSRVLKLNHFVLCKINPGPLCVVFHSPAPLSVFPSPCLPTPPSFPMLCLQAPFYEWEGSRQPLGEPCFQPRHVSSTLAQFALRSVSWSGAAGLPPTIIDLACSSASPLSPSSLTGLCLDKVLEALLWC